jgi:two-component system LytT family response regulator
MIRSIIVDDELRGRQTLQNLLAESCPNVEVLALCESVAAAREAIALHKPQLVFLDVEMPQENGFALLEEAEHINFDVIFTTAHSHHAIKAIKLSALDYLLKPIDIDELVAAVEKVAAKKPASGAKHIQMLLQNTAEKEKQQEKIALPTTDGYVFVRLSDILRCDAHGSYTMFYFTDGETLLVCKNLKEFEDLLTDLNFFRVHHSHIVNMSHIQRYLRGDGGTVVLKDGSQVEVARRKKEQFLQALMQNA